MQLNPEHLVQVGRRVRADQQHLLAGVGQRQRGGRGQRSLADAAFAREEQISGRLGQKSDRVGLQPRQHLVVRRKATGMHDLAAYDNGGHRVNVVALDVFRVLDLDDLDPDTCGQRSPLDDADGAAAPAASRAQNFDLHLDAFSFELIDLKSSSANALP